MDNTQQPPEIGLAVKTNNPVPPEIGVPAHTPLLTPLGVYPQFETPTNPQWPYTGGSNG